MDGLALGIFVGGRSSRMGEPKGLLKAPTGDETLLERLVRLGHEVGLEPLLVGDASPYVGEVASVPRIGDQPGGIGPIGGLRGLLLQRSVAIVVACDMPAVDAELLRRLRDATGVVASRNERWEPLCARYEAALALPAIDASLRAGEHSLQRLLDRIGPTVLAVSTEKLVDWDEPGDLSDAPRGG